MDYNPPSGSDYAASDARQAHKTAKALIVRVQMLEKAVAQLHLAVSRLTTDKQEFSNDHQHG